MLVFFGKIGFKPHVPLTASLAQWCCWDYIDMIDVTLWMDPANFYQNNFNLNAQPHNMTNDSWTYTKKTFFFFIRERYEDQDIPFCRPLHGFHLSTGWNEMFWQPGLWNMAKGLNNSNDLDSWLRLEKTGLPLFWLCVWPVCWRSRWRQDPRWRSPRVHLPMWRESMLGRCHNFHCHCLLAKLSQMF